MQVASLKILKDELKERSPEEIMKLCLRLGRFKKENKELMTYLLFSSENEEEYVKEVKVMMEEEFNQINTKNYYFQKKSIRKILKETKKFIRYSSVKETEVALLIHFCRTLKAFKPNIKRNRVIYNIFERQIEYIKRKLPALHEDLQFDYEEELNEVCE